MRTTLPLLIALGLSGCATVRANAPADVGACIQASADALRADVAAVLACQPPKTTAPSSPPTQ